MATESDDTRAQVTTVGGAGSVAAGLGKRSREDARVQWEVEGLEEFKRQARQRLHALADEMIDGTRAAGLRGQWCASTMSRATGRVGPRKRVDEETQNSSGKRCHYHR